MNLQQLYYFKTTAELEHYTRAAQELNISQSCLSHSITDLEQELGVSLFVRQGRNVRLTKCGAFFLEYVTQALNTLDEGRERLQDFISSDTGFISIGHLSSLSDFVPYLISRFFADT
ncbi:MAG: LysR family transcriptional regulator, partial [Lachnospiraceae bacterium]|nr:LysR family transcriptional regulator [Lachnospiraceae bacterium]